MSSTLRLFFSFAHPDDESFAAAGVACKYGDAGAEIALVTATRGDAGKVGDPPICTTVELPARREAELLAVAGILGIQHVHLLGYRDRELATAPPDRIRGELVRLIRRHCPHVVVTFDPNGLNQHPDHVAISRFTSEAVAAAADPRWHVDAGPAHRVTRLLWTPPIPPWEVGRTPALETHAGIDFLFDIEPWRDRKAAALRAHRTQHLSIDRLFFSQPDVDRLLSVEAYRQAWGPPLPAAPADDLAIGVSVVDA